ncbi:MAG TPA: type II toxin-antitoxin system prevent-host-death family antitoxin [Acidobacteriaceae bacterium]|jgi:prevent-host-death family protein|nr:type II toxin-antitoxin system prevent-host-death family antitoxin [Acidobacteriaceae bacterium]
MPITTIHEAKTHLSRLIERAERGEEILIARGKQPVVRLTPLKKPGQKRQLGLFKGEFQVAAAFFEPLPAEEMDAWD